VTRVANIQALALESTRHVEQDDIGLLFIPLAIDDDIRALIEGGELVDEVGEGQAATATATATAS
jgi:hypothetical protein